jgi:RNA polymerase sigma factor (sigma-70 family)
MAANADDLGWLLEDWRAGRAERGDLYDAVRGAMRQAARRGIGSTISGKPDEQDVEDVVFDAFLELERMGPHQITSSMVGLAKTIADRRGRDRGRQINRQRKQLRELMTDPAYRTRLEFSDEDVRRAEQDERRARVAMECLEKLTADQRAVVAETIMGRTTVSDWALREGKTWQAASRQRRRAVDSLVRCVRDKLRGESGGSGGGDE